MFSKLPSTIIPLHQLFSGCPCAADVGTDFTVTDRYVGKGDYLRLSKVRAAYDIPLKKQTVVKSVAVSLTGYDLIYWRAFPRWNPAVLGVNYDVCPTSAAMLLGVSLTFGRK